MTAGFVAFISYGFYILCVFWYIQMVKILAALIKGEKKEDKAESQPLMKKKEKESSYSNVFMLLVIGGLSYVFVQWQIYR